MGGAREGEWDKEGRKKVWCPVRNCKGEGWVAREDWDGVDEEDGEEEMEVESGLNGNEKKVSFEEAGEVGSRCRRVELKRIG